MGLNGPPVGDPASSPRCPLLKDRRPIHNKIADLPFLFSSSSLALRDSIKDKVGNTDRCFKKFLRCIIYFQLFSKKATCIMSLLVFCIRFIIEREVFSMSPKFFTTTIKSHAATCKVYFYTLFINTHNLCDRILVSVKRSIAFKRKLCSLYPVIYFNH